MFSESEQLPYETNYFRFQFNPQHRASRSVSGSKAPGEGFHRRETSSCTSATTIPARSRRTSGCSATRCDGETLLFAREDGVEASWRVVDNVLTDHGPAIPYHAPHVGPGGAEPAARGPRREAWHEPVIDCVTVEPLPTPSAPPVAGPYSPAVRAGDCVVLAGQVGIGGDGKLVPAGSRPRPSRSWPTSGPCWTTAVGRGPTSPSATIFLTDLGNFATVNALYEGAIGAHRPARTTIGVAGLPAGSASEWRSSAGRTCPRRRAMTDRSREDRRRSGGRSCGPEQYQVLRQAGTERAFTGKYWDCHDDGVYRCAGCGAELFDASTKFESGTGWPSFTEPMVADAVEIKVDSSHGMVRRRSSAAVRRAPGPRVPRRPRRRPASATA